MTTDGNGWSRYEKQVLYQLQAIDSQVKDLDKKVEQRVSDVQARINELATSDIADLRAELKTSRHDLASKVATVGLRVDRLEYQHADALRRFEENDARADKYIPLIEHLLSEETVASRVKKHGLTRLQRWVLYAALVSTFIAALGTALTAIVLL